MGSHILHLAGLVLGCLRYGSFCLTVIVFMRFLTSFVCNGWVVCVQLSLLQSLLLGILVAVCMVMLARFLTVNLCDCCYPRAYGTCPFL